MDTLGATKVPNRVGAGPRLAAAALDYVMSTIAVTVCALQGWGWSNVVEHLPQSSELLSLYQPMDDALVEAGLVRGVMGLLAASALLGIVYPLVEGLTGASPGKWMLGLRVAHADGRSGHVSLYMKRFVIKFIRPVLGTIAGLSGLGLLGWLAGPAGLVVTLGTLLLLAPHRQALHDKLAVTAVFRRVEL